MSGPIAERDRQSILRDLESADEEVRRLAVERLGGLPPSESLPRLVACLGDADWRVRKSAVERMVASVDLAPVVDALIRALADGENPGRRNSAVEALVEIGEPAVPALIATLDSDDVDVRKFAVDSLAGVGSHAALEALVRMLADPDSNVRAAAADALGVIGGEGSGVALRRVAVDADEDQLVRFSALRALARLEEPVAASELAPALDDPMLRAAAFGVLGRVDDPEAVDRLLKGVVSGSRATRESAMEALLRLLGSVDGARADQLASGLRETVEGERELLASLAGRLDSADLAMRLVHVQFMGLLDRPECAVPILRAGRDEAIREIAHQTLESMGGVAESALDAAWNALDGELRCDACAVLGSLSGEAGSRRLRSALDEADAELRGAAARALGRRGCVESIDALVRRLLAAAQGEEFDSEEEVAALIDGLVSIAASDAGAGADSATGRIVDLLAAELGSASEPVRHAIASVLARMGRPADAPLVTMLLKDPSAGVRRAAVDALSRLAPGGVSEPLRLALADESSGVRVAAVAALGASGDASALDDLRRLLHDEDERVRAAALRAIGALADRGSEAGVDLRAAGAAEWVEGALADTGTVALAAIDALGRIGGCEAARSASAVLTRNEPELVQAAVACIGRHGDVDTVEDLLALVAHDSWTVRSEAIQALAERRITKAIPPILRRLETETDDFVRDVILRALRRLEELP